MQGILKSNHQRLCDILHDVKEMPPASEFKLNEMEGELCSVFSNYQKKMTELKQLIQVYEEKKKTITSVIKKIRKCSVGISKKTEHIILGKASILIFFLSVA